MADVRLDHGVLHRMVYKAVVAAVGALASVVDKSEAEPTRPTNGRVVRVRGISLTPNRRTQRVEVDSGMVAVVIAVSANTATTSTTALESLLSTIAVALEERRLTDTDAAATDHSIVFGRAMTECDGPADEQMRMVTGRVALTGTAFRETGATVEAQT